ncbi:MAG: thioredoxin family protein [Gammaproteobacteria bacterium]|nr:thioredoxin family protein [Gammaproteobacteria bacterium]
MLLSIAVSCGAAGRDPYTHFFNDTFGDFTEELTVAREQGKKGILIFFEMDECPFCHRMKQTVLNQPRVQEWYRDNFLIFPVDVEGDTEITDFEGNTMRSKDFAEKKNRVRATPVFAFYDLEGNRVVRYTGATSDVDEFLWLGEFVAEGHYKDTNFVRYKRQKRSQGE